MNTATAITAFAPLPQPAGHDLLVFLVQVGLLLGLALVLGRVAARFGLPAVVGELLTGVLVGPSLLGHVTPGLWHWLFPSAGAQANMLNAIAQLGMLLLVGVSGMHVDLRGMRRRGATAVRVSAGGLLVPLALGLALGYVLPAALLAPTGTRSVFVLFLGVAMSVSAIPVIAKTLLDMKLLHRDVGQLTLAAGAVDDAVGWCLLSVVTAMAAGGVHADQLALTVVEIVGFVLAMAFVGRPVARLLFRLAGRSPEAGPSTATALLLIVAGATATKALGLEPAFGAFAAGVLLSTAGVRAEVDRARLAPLRTVVLWVAAPIFLATAGLRMDLTVLADGTVLLWAVVVLVAAVVGKFAGAYLGATRSGLSARERFALGAGMNARGVVEVVVAMVGLQLGVLTTTTYTIVVLVAIATSLMSPPLLRRAMSGVDHTAEERLRELDHARWSAAPEPARTE
ncbi:MAG TPA: cation:proton antiporter [Jatrophihabitans sp.]|nr:cation:proton antiporter [Jatrophihabitans sp.]